MTGTLGIRTGLNLYQSDTLLVGYETLSHRDASLLLTGVFFSVVLLSKVPVRFPKQGHVRLRVHVRFEGAVRFRFHPETNLKRGLDTTTDSRV